MSTANRLAQGIPGAGNGQWPHYMTDRTGGIARPSAQSRTATAAVAPATPGTLAGDDEDWDGGFEGHLGVYRRF
ncbi:MAG: hypothetical protein F9K29_11255 [Hyphomicrobiaceae bacterium]|nr:MAG: hypothetical protein F9K29_11255 [Hyphomicrobiaceae bacterium]